jgi:hypothetical protein
MPAAAKKDQLLFSFREADTQQGISRATTKKLAHSLGFTGETQVLHYALIKLAKEVLPAYEADDGPLNAKQMTKARLAMPQGKSKKIKSSLI